MTQGEREATATRVNLLEARANLQRTEAASLELEARRDTARLEVERICVELEKNAESATRQRQAVAQLEAKYASYPKTVP